jgi:ribosome-associated protein
VAFERLAARIDQGLQVDPVRRATRPTKGSQVRRVESKRKHAETKRQRRAPGADE